MKYTEEYLRQVCINKDLEFIDIEYKELDKKRRGVNFICNKHRDKGTQFIVVEKIDKTKQPCKYCNHSNLKETFREDIAKVNPDIEVIDEYTEWNTPLLCRCKIHDYQWKGRISVLLKGGGCINCAGEKRWDSRGRITTEDFKIKMETINPNIEIIGEYFGSHEFIECKCKIHGTIWESKACNIQNGTANCPTCASVSQHKANLMPYEVFLDKLSRNAPHITPVSEYNGVHRPMIFHCLEHDIDFESTPKQFIWKKGKGCPLCSQSYGERKMINILLEKDKNISLQHVFNGCSYVHPLRFDAYDIDNRVAYEYQGQQHYYPVAFDGNKEKALEEYKLCVVRDNIKEQYCNDNNISLVKIPYWDIDDMDKYIA